jgi:hypothetical protein
MCALNAINSRRQNQRLFNYISISACIVEILAKALAVIYLRVRDVVARVLCFVYLLECLLNFPGIKKFKQANAWDFFFFLGCRPRLQMLKEPIE